MNFLTGFLRAEVAPSSKLFWSRGGERKTSVVQAEFVFFEDGGDVALAFWRGSFGLWGRGEDMRDILSGEVVWRGDVALGFLAAFLVFWRREVEMQKRTWSVFVVFFF